MATSGGSGTRVTTTARRTNSHGGAYDTRVVTRQARQAITTPMIVRGAQSPKAKCR
jgi:hypothetical protein